MSRDTIDLGPLEEFDQDRAIDLKEARKLLRGRGGPASLEVVRRWTHPRHGCRPQGPDGLRVVLPAVKLAGCWFTMPSWAAAFEKARQRLGLQAARNVDFATSPAKASAAHRRAVEQLRRDGFIIPDAAS
jgi:hypothetical protein